MKAVVMHWPSLVDTAGKVVTTTWEELFDRFSRVAPFRGDREHPGWSGAVFDPPVRSLENVRRVTAVVLDYDGTETEERVIELWGQFFGFVHTTRKHAPESPRFRVVLPLSRPVTPDEYARIWRRVNERAGGKLDPQPKDPSRYWFTPGIREGGSFRAWRFDGRPLDADAFLAMPEPQTHAPVVHLQDAREDRERRAIAYIERMPEATAGSGGHAATWAVARKLAQDFGLDEGATFRILWTEYNPRCRPPWTEKELRHKARDAAAKARVANPIDDRHWELPRSHYGAPRAPDVDEDGVIIENASTGQPEAKERVSAVQRYGARTVAELLEAVVVRAETQRPERGVTSGNFELDDALGGFRRQRITILGAETSFGKSSFAVMTADEGMQAGAGVLLVTGEDGPDTYGQRLMARRSGVNALRLRDNMMLDEDIEQIRRQAARAERVPFFLDGIGKPAEVIARAISDICAENPIALVIVDYVQAFSCTKRCQDRRAEVTHIARLFVDAIKTSNAAGLILSQLRRPDNSNRAPSMHDLKESGDLENMAEHVLLGNLRQAESGEHRSILIGKNKDGARNGAEIEMPWDQKTASFKTVRGEMVNRYDDAFQSTDPGPDFWDN